MGTIYLNDIKYGGESSSGGGSENELTSTILFGTVGKYSSSINDTYTASQNEIVIALNWIINGEASSKSLTADITTTGTIKTSYVKNISTWSSPNRNTSLKVSLISLSAGNTITFVNSGDGSHLSYSHIIFKNNTLNDVSIFEEIEFSSVSDSGIDYEYQLTNDKYLAIAYQSGDGGYASNKTSITLGNSISSDVFTINNNDQDKYVGYIPLYLGKSSSKMCINCSSSSNYVSANMLILKLKS